MKDGIFFFGKRRGDVRNDQILMSRLIWGCTQRCKTRRAKDEWKSFAKELVGIKGHGVFL